MTTSEKDLRVLLQGLGGYRDGNEGAAFGRDLVCTPCGGHYGSVAAWVIAVNGSPPRGMIVYNPHFDIPITAYWVGVEKSRRLGNGQAKVVKKFADEHLGEQCIDKATVVILKAGEPKCPVPAAAAANA